MPLPSLIEIVPLGGPVRAEITVPGSKSITNRALILAALAEGEVRLEGALWSEDTQVMVECLQELGFMVNIERDPAEDCNRTITVYGRGGSVPRGGTEEQPLELFVGNAGTAARFLTAMLCLGSGVYRLHGVPRMHERPQAALFEALRQLGYRVDSENDKLPALIHGAGRKAGMTWVSITQSSQFASALLLSAKTGGWEVHVAGENEEESPYVIMTAKMIEAFPSRGGVFQIEPDASSASYFLGAGHAEIVQFEEQIARDGRAHAWSQIQPTIRIAHWPSATTWSPPGPLAASGAERSIHAGLPAGKGAPAPWQIDAAFEAVFGKMTFCSPHFEIEGPELSTEARLKRKLQCRDTAARAYMQAYLLMRKWGGKVRGGFAFGGCRTISRRADLGDSVMTAIVLAPLAILPTQFVDLGRLRLQECERVLALRTELTKCGADIIEEGDTLEVYPSALRGADIETYNDHRMAMCFAILGLKLPGVRIKNPACVKKTFPNFFQKLAAPPPRGLGAAILNGETREPLSPEELFAD